MSASRDDLDRALSAAYAEIDTLRAQLAELSGLAMDAGQYLSGALPYYRQGASEEVIRDANRVCGEIRSLSASAEPSAPKCGTCNDSGLEYDSGAAHPCTDCKPVERDERAQVTIVDVLRAYEYANEHPHKYLRGTTNWCAAVAYSLNGQARAALEKKS